MISTDQAQQLLGGDATVIGSDGDKLGKLGQIYLDDQTNEPEWVTVSTGLFGTSESFVPLAQATVTGDSVQVPYDKDKVKNAPRVDADGALSAEQESELYAYYGLGHGTADYDTTRTDTTRTDTARTDAAGTVGHDTSGPTTDDAMTRSEEQLHVGTRREEAGRARLRKFVVTEQQTVTVPVEREQIRIEREPITADNMPAAVDGPAISEEEHEVVLHEERAVVAKETVPVERIRLDTETVVEQQTVTESVRKEQIETEGVGVDSGRDSDLRDSGRDSDLRDSDLRDSGRDATGRDAKR